MVIWFHLICLAVIGNTLAIPYEWEITDTGIQHKNFQQSTLEGGQDYPNDAKLPKGTPKATIGQAFARWYEQLEDTVADDVVAIESVLGYSNNTMDEKKFLRKEMHRDQSLLVTGIKDQPIVEEAADAVNTTSSMFLSAWNKCRSWWNGLEEEVKDFFHFITKLLDVIIGLVALFLVMWAVKKVRAAYNFVKKHTHIPEEHELTAV